MASRKQQKRKQKARRQASRPRKIDVLDLPFGRIAVHGRFARVSNTATPEEHAEFRAGLLAAKPDIKERVSANRERLVEILRSVDPADLVARASLVYLHFDPNTYLEWEDDRSPGHVEYLALQALAVGLDSTPTAHPAEAPQLTDEAIEIARSLFFDAEMLLVLHSLEDSGGQGEPIADYQFKERISSLAVRGTGYAEHHQRVIAGCFTPLDDLCKRVLGFTAANALEIHAGVVELINGRVSERVAQSPEDYTETTRELKRARKSGASETLPSWLLELPPNEAKAHVASMVQSWTFLDSRSLAVFTAEEVADATGLPPEVVKSFLDAFVCEPAEFDEELHGLPSGAHPLTAKPVLRVGDGYLIPVLRTVLETIRPRMEDLLSEDRGAWDKYVRHRGRFVEQEVSRLLADAFPGSRSWTGLGWRSEADQSDIDGLVDCGDIAIRLQCKSGRITAPVRRGAPKRMLEELGELVGEAAEQHARLAQTLELQTPLALGFADNETRALSRPLQIEAIVTLDEITTWATQAHRLQGLDILPAERSVPWILSLTDLMVVVDLLEGASLAHYLIRRQRLERDRRIEAHDELDWVGHYIAEGLFFDQYFEGEDAPGGFKLMSYTDEIDAWYFTKQGLRPRNPAPRPRQAVPEPLDLLLRRLASERPEHWLIASVALLEGGDDSRNLWADGVERIRSRARSEGWSNTTQMLESRLGVTLFVDHRGTPAAVRRAAREYARDKASKNDMPNWIVIGEGTDHRLFVLLQAEQGTSEIFEHFLAPPQQVRS